VKELPTIPKQFYAKAPPGKDFLKFGCSEDNEEDEKSAVAASRWEEGGQQRCPRGTGSLALY